MIEFLHTVLQVSCRKTNLVPHEDWEQKEAVVLHGLGTRTAAWIVLMAVIRGLGTRTAAA